MEWRAGRDRGGQCRGLAYRLAGDDLPGSEGAPPAASGATLATQLEHVERTLIADALRRQRGDVVATAQALGIGKQTLYDKLKRLGLRAEDFR